MIEEDELQMIRQMKDLKRDYRDLFSKLKEVKGAISYHQELIDNFKQTLVAEFEAWYDETFEDKVEQITQASPSKTHKTSVSFKDSHLQQMQSMSRMVQDPSMNEDLQHMMHDDQEREGIDTD